MTAREREAFLSFVRSLRHIANATTDATAAVEEMAAALDEATRAEAASAAPEVAGGRDVTDADDAECRVYEALDRLLDFGPERLRPGDPLTVERVADHPPNHYVRVRGVTRQQLRQWHIMRAAATGGDAGLEHDLRSLDAACETRWTYREVSAESGAKRVTYIAIRYA